MRLNAFLSELKGVVDDDVIQLGSEPGLELAVTQDDARAAEMIEWLMGRLSKENPSSTWEDVLAALDSARWWVEFFALQERASAVRHRFGRRSMLGFPNLGGATSFLRRLLP